jgi:hypothetical protein
MPLYGSFPAKLANKEIDWDTDTIKVALCTSSYTPDQDTHDYFNDVTNEVSGTGYTAGGATLASKTVTYTSGTNTQTFDAADVTWASSTITARYAVIYDSTGTAGTSALIGYVDFGSNVVSSGGDFTIQWNASGIFTISVT